MKLASVELLILTLLLGLRRFLRVAPVSGANCFASLRAVFCWDENESYSQQLGKRKPGSCEAVRAVVGGAGAVGYA